MIRLGVLRQVRLASVIRFWITQQLTYIFFFTYNLGNTYKRTVWFYNRGDFDKLNDLIGTKIWDFLNEGDLDTACTNFTSSLMKFIKQCVPYKEVIIRPNDKP